MITRSWRCASDQDYRGHATAMSQMTPAEHRRNFLHVAAAVHATRRALHHTMRRHYYGHDGSAWPHVQHAFRTVTGHETPHAMLEHILTRHPHPLDSLLSYVPVPASYWPFSSWASYDEHHPDSWYHTWTAKRVAVLKHADGDLDPLASGAADLTVQQRYPMHHWTLETREELAQHEVGRELLSRQARQFSAPQASACPQAAAGRPVRGERRA